MADGQPDRRWTPASRTAVRLASRSLDFLEDLMYFLGCLLVAFLVFGITYDVLGRQFFGTSAPGVVEVSEYIMVWLPFLAAARLLREGGHVRVLFVLDRLGPRTREPIERIMMVVGLAVIGVLAWYSFGLVAADYERDIMLVNIYTTPRWLVRSMVPIGFFVLGLEFVRGIWRQTKESRNRHVSQPGVTSGGPSL